ncbi:MAG: type IV pilus assembly protein PilM [Proteobacteria bacterium]|nr:type IV pilus assembly protein PilM [Pseudomonadota bacterium]
MRQIIPMLISIIVAAGVYFFFSYVMYRIGRKFVTGSFLEYCIPLYNMVLMCRCGNISPWNVLGLMVPIVNIYFAIHIWGSIAQRLGKSYWLYGIGSLFFYITVFIMAFDNSSPSGYILPDTISENKDLNEQEQDGHDSSIYTDTITKNKDYEENKINKKAEKRKEKNAKSTKAGFLPGLDILSKIGLRTINELIGLDIGSVSIKICTLKKTNDGFQIQNIAKKSYEEDILSDGNIIDQVFVAQELKKLIAENNIKCKDVACALSSYTIITKKVMVPFLEEEELENSIRLEVEAVIPFPLKDIYYSYHVLGVDEEKEDMMNIQIVAAKKEIVDGYTTAFNLAGLNLQILDVDIFAVTNIIEQIYNPKDFSVVAVDIGASITNIAIIKNNSVEFTREILLGGKYLTNQIEKSTKLSHIEAEEKKIIADSEVAYLFEDYIFNISSEITKTINFYTATKPNDTIGKIYLTGGSSLLKGLREKIEEDSRIEIEYIDPLLLLNLDQAKHRAYEEYSTFMSIALYLSSRVTDLGQ